VTVEYLSIELTDHAEHCAWAAFDASGHLVTRVMRGPLAAARAAAEGRRVLVLVPAPDVLIAQAMLPAGSQARLRQLVPYSLEEALADDVEELAFAVGPRLASGAVSVAVVAKQKLERWLAELAAAGIAPHAVFGAVEGAPDTPSTLTLMLSGSVICGRRPGSPPFTLDGVSIAEVLELARAGGDPDASDLKHLLVYADDEGHRLHQAEFATIGESVESCEIKLLPDGVFPHLAAALITRPGTNLLQGAYAPKSNWAALARPWRAAAGLLIAVGVLALAGQGIEQWSLRREDARLTEQLAADCQRIASSARLSVCEAEVQRRLASVAGAGGGDGETFLSTLAAIADARKGDSRIDALSYRNRIMDLQIMASNVTALDEFARGLVETQRFDARIQSSNPDPSGVQGRVQVESMTR
jgi:general secretion pathway protein L